MHTRVASIVGWGSNRDLPNGDLRQFACDSDSVGFRINIKHQRSSGGFVRGVLLLAVLGLYLVGLVIWTPLFLIWPRRYPDMTYLETIATRWVLVRHIWTNLVRKAP